MDADQSRRKFSLATVARMATVGTGSGTQAGVGAHAPAPHLVPVTFALLGDDTLVTAVDHKPKRTTALRRLANIAQNDSVCLLVDEYCDDWSMLWWARADGRARVVVPNQETMLRTQAIDALVARYVQYARQRPSGDVIVVEVERWSGWRA